MRTGTHCRCAERDVPMLFPGGQPGRPISSYRLAECLREHGIHSGQAHSTALFQLATDLPAAVLARLPGGEGEESFDFEVCTPGWLHELIRRDGPVNGRHHVIIDTFNWPALQSYFQKLVTRCPGQDWHEIAAKLSRYGHWEFEDYAPAAGNADL